MSGIRSRGKRKSSKTHIAPVPFTSPTQGNYSHTDRRPAVCLPACLPAQRPARTALERRIRIWQHISRQQGSPSGARSAISGCPAKGPDHVRRNASTLCIFLVRDLHHRNTAVCESLHCAALRCAAMYVYTCCQFHESSCGEQGRDQTTSVQCWGAGGPST